MPKPLVASKSKFVTHISCLLLGWSLGALAQDHEHRPLPVDPGLDFAAVLEAGIANAPQLLEAEVRSEQAKAMQRAGRQLLAGRPALNLSLYDDSLLDNVGLQEQEFGLQLPLRRPGEGREARLQGERYQQELESWQNWLAWSLAGELRTVLADIELAEQNLALQRETLALAEDLQQATTSLFEAGALARLDLLQSQNAVLEQQQNVLHAEAELVDAERYFAVLTGLSRRPAALPAETLEEEEHIPPSHPWLQYLQAQVDVAASNLTQSRISAKGNPQLTLGTRRERGDRFQPMLDSVAVSLNIPIGGKSIVDSRSSAARLQQVSAEVALQQARRELQQALHEAEHELQVTRAALPLAEQQASLAEERLAMARSAFDTGEVDLQQVLIALQDAAEARSRVRSLQLTERRLIAEYNQNLGVLR